MTKDLPDEWFRPASPASAEGAAGARPVGDPAATASRTSPVRTQPTPTSAVTPPIEVTPRPPQVRPAPVPVVTSPHHVAGPKPERRREPWVGRHPIVLTTLTVGLATVVGVTGGLLVVQRRDRMTQPGTTPSSQASSSTSSNLKPWDGRTKVLTPEAVTASCTAPPSKDEQGKQVTYEAAKVLDTDPATAWRCPGDGTGVTLTFTLAPGSTVVGVGLVNGYLKGSGTDALYPQYRRITSVKWQLGDGAWFIQTLSDNDPGLQQVLTPPIEVAGPVRATIESSSAAGVSDDPTRDAVLISTVQFLTKG